MNDDSNSFIDEKKLGQPTQLTTDFDEETKLFITEVMALVYEGQINLLSPSSLMNKDIYDKSTEEVQGMADIFAQNYCAKLRRLKDLMELSGGEQLFITPTFEALTIVQDLKYSKEQFENKHGDMFII